MKEIIKDLIEYYFSLKRVIKETTVTKTTAGTEFRVTPLRASQLWEMYDDREKPDDRLADNFIENEKERVAEEIFDMTENILFTLGELEEAYMLSSKRTFTTPQEKVNWSIRNLIRVEVIDVFDQMILSRVEKDGVGMGYKRKVESKEEGEREKAQKIIQESGFVPQED